MLNKRTMCLSIMAALVSFCSALQAADNPTVVITTKEPAAKEEIVVPEGSISCTTTKARWVNGEWHTQYRACRYNVQDSTVKVQGEGWVGGHWVCTQYKTTADGMGECSNWDWKPSRWVKTYKEIAIE